MRPPLASGDGKSLFNASLVPITWVRDEIDDVRQDESSSPSDFANVLTNAMKLLKDKTLTFEKSLPGLQLHTI